MCSPICVQRSVTDDYGRALKTDHLGAVGLDVYEGESAYFYSDSSTKIIHDDKFARLISFYNVFIRFVVSSIPVTAG